MHNPINKHLLDLFNSILITKEQDRHIDEIGYTVFEDAGVIVIGNNLTIKHLEDIYEHIQKSSITSSKISKSFFHGWSLIKRMSDYEYYSKQFHHYLTSFLNRLDNTFPVYLPINFTSEDNTVSINDNLFVITEITREEVVQRCTNLLTSGIALDSEKIKIIVEILQYFDCDISLIDGIKNKEVISILMDQYGYANYTPEDVVRYIVYKCTGSTLLIKSKEVIDNVKMTNTINSNWADPTYWGVLKDIKPEFLAPVFNRFKPIFLAMKVKSEGTTARDINTYVNRVSKLSKKLHKPMKENTLKKATTKIISKEDLANATVWNLLKVFKVLSKYIPVCDDYSNRLFSIRNGKLFSTKKSVSINIDVIESNFNIIVDELRTRLPHLNGRTVYIPDNVRYAIPTSEKMFLGSIPFGTVFTSRTDKMVSGVYWHEDGGISDLDLSYIDISGNKVGWDDFRMRSGTTFSGDITSAPNGANEFILSEAGDHGIHLVQANVYHECSRAPWTFKLIIGDNYSGENMLDLKSIMHSSDIVTESRQTVLGVLFTENNTKYFVVISGAFGKSISSRFDEKSKIALSAILEDVTRSAELDHLLSMIGCNVVNNLVGVDLETIDYNLDNKNLTVDSFVNLLTPPVN